jgi:hypothetical protein
MYLNQFKAVKCFLKKIAMMGNVIGVPQNMEYVFRVLSVKENWKHWSTPREIQAGVPQGSILSPASYSLYTNDAPLSPGVHLAFFANDTWKYCTDWKEGYVLRKLQRSLILVETWCECWNIKINEDNAQAIYALKDLDPQDTSYIERTENPICKSYKISRCNLW